MEENRIHTAIQDTLVEASEMLYEKWSHSEELDDAIEKVYDAIAETSGENEEVQAAVNAYRINGMPKRNFEKMIRAGLLRYQKKLGNIQKHFREKSTELKESMYHHGIYTHHGSLYIVC